MSASTAAGSSRGARYNIGQVLDQLRADFPGVTIPKIRFLEDQGLVKPERTAAGYRKFSTDDVSRLRYILTMQRDHYLPFKVIGDHLDAIDRGLEPPAISRQAASCASPMKVIGEHESRRPFACASSTRRRASS